MFTIVRVNELPPEVAAVLEQQRLDALSSTTETQEQPITLVEEKLEIK